LSLYLHLERNRFLDPKPERLTEKYYKGELDKKGKAFTEKETKFYRVVIK